jgi:hypothetical protein
MSRRPTIRCLLRFGAPHMTSIARWATDLRVREIPGGHWLPRQKPDVIAR